MVLDSADVVAMIEDESDLTVTLSSTSTINGEAIQTGEDQDSLAGISCSGGQVLVYDVLSSNWGCGNDQDTTLTESEVRTMMEGASGLSLNLTSTSNVDGAVILTSDTTLEVDWNNINNRPTGLDDGDDVRQLRGFLHPRPLGPADARGRARSCCRV